MSIIIFPHTATRQRNFLQNLATKKNIQLIVFRAAPESTPEKGIEEWARNFRYESISKLIKKSSLVLTAHHAKDQTETLIHHIIRGSGPYGLAGMPRLRKIGESLLFRPLLDVPRKSYKISLKSEIYNGLKDPANHELRFLRNKIRKLIIPGLADTSMRLKQT